MKRSSDSQPDISCMSIMDKFGLASPTRPASAAARYRPPSSASPSHLHHLLRSHGNASSAAAAEADMRGERREDGDGRSCDSIAACAVPVSDTGTPTVTSTITTAAAAAAASTSRQPTTPHRHHHLATAAESDDDDDDELTERRRRRLRLPNTTTTAAAATADTTTTDDDDQKRRSETFGVTDSGSVSTSATLSIPLLQHHEQQRRRQPVDDAAAGVHSSGVKTSTQPSFSPVMHHCCISVCVYL